MSTSLVIVSDTHIPKRARDLPSVLWNAIESADLVIHAGDWVEVALLDELEARSARLVGVVGNNDGPDLRARMPEVATAVVDGIPQHRRKSARPLGNVRVGDDDEGGRHPSIMLAAGASVADLVVSVARRRA